MHRQAPPEQFAAWAVLEPDVLAIGFTRRFATYKRATLVFRDIAVEEHLTNPDMPVQIVIAGKAHQGHPGNR